MQRWCYCNWHALWIMREVTCGHSRFGVALAARVRPWLDHSRQGHQRELLVAHVATEDAAVVRVSGDDPDAEAAAGIQGGALAAQVDGSGGLRIVTSVGEDVADERCL